MNPGVIEEGGKAAGIFMTVMKDQPLALALVVCNILLLALFFYVAKQASANRAHEFQLVLEAQKDVQKLLYNCVPADRRGDLSLDFKLQSDEIVPMPRPRPVEAQ